MSAMIPGRTLRRFLADQVVNLQRRVGYAVSTVLDTPARRQAEAALRESEVRFRQILEAAPDAMVIVDRERRITMVNARASALFGFSAEELIGHPLELLVPDRLRGGHRQHYDRYFERPHARPMGVGRALFARRKDGTEVSVEVSLSPVRAAEGVLVIAAIRDVSERKEAEHALRKSEAAYRDLVTHAPFGIYRSTREGRLLSANAALATMLGYGSVAELLVLDLQRDVYVDPHEREALVARHQSQDSIGNVETDWQRKDGRRITVRLNGRTLRDESGTLEGFEVLVEDVTGRRRLEAQLRQAQKLEAVGRLAGGVAHDFSNLLTAILGVSELLILDLAPDDRRRADVMEIRDVGLRAAALTRQLLAFSRRQVLAPRRLDLNALVASAERLLRRVIGEDIQVRTALHPALGTVEADPGELERVLLNLAVNARDAMPAGGTLTISTTNAELDGTNGEGRFQVAAGSYVVLAVTDTGTGMDRETQAHLFEPFFTTKEAGKGTGLGLATAYGVIKQSGGYIWVDSEPGHGTAFRIYLPRVAGAAEPPSPEPEEPVRGGREVILLVEDADSVRRVAQRVLEGAGYAVLCASNGAEALDIFKQREADIDLVVTDLVMPGMGGYRLYEILRDEGKQVNCLFMSGYNEPDGSERRRVAQFPLLQKPWTVPGLLRHVRESLDTTAARKGPADGGRGQGSPT